MDHMQLNVGGTVFATLRTTLVDVEPESILADLFRNDPLPTMLDRAGNWFLDRDPETFRLVLEWLRTAGTVSPTDANARAKLKKEAEHFRLQKLLEFLKPPVRSSLLRGPMIEFLFRMLPQNWKDVSVTPLVARTNMLTSNNVRVGAQTTLFVFHTLTGYTFGAVIAHFNPVERIVSSNGMGFCSPRASFLFSFGGGYQCPVKLGYCGVDDYLVYWSSGSFSLGSDLKVFGGQFAYQPNAFKLCDPSFAQASQPGDVLALLAGSGKGNIDGIEVFEIGHN